MGKPSFTRGQFIVFSGPSGVGKGTIIQSILSQRPETYLAVSATTRTPREKEIDGKDYFFLKPAEFESNIESDSFVEYCLVHGNYYGTLKSEIETRIDNGQNVIIEIDVQGARKAKRKYPDLVGIFIKPPSKDDLVHRLKYRNTDPPAVIERRLSEVDTEMAAMPEYDFIVENDNLDQAIKDVLVIIDNLK